MDCNGPAKPLARHSWTAWRTWTPPGQHACNARPLRSHACRHSYAKNPPRRLTIAPVCLQRQALARPPNFPGALRCGVSAASTARHPGEPKSSKRSLTMLPLMPVLAAQVLGSALKTKTALLASVQSMIDEDLSFVSSEHTGETLPTVPVRHDEPFSAADKERLSRRFQQASGRPARHMALDPSAWSAPDQALGFHGNAGLESSRPRPMIAHRTIQAGVPGRGGIWQREDTVIQFLPEDLQNRGETTGIDGQMDPCAASENCEKPPLRQPGQDMSPARGSPHLPGRSDDETGTPHARERDVDTMETWAESISDFMGANRIELS